MTHLRFSLVILVLASCAAASGAEEILVAEVWEEHNPVLPFSRPREPDAEVVGRSLLTEARFVFSGMIYGFRFSYTPSDVTRQVAEEFVLEPVAEVQWGDPRLTVVSSRSEDQRSYARFRYMPSADQEARLAAWRSSAIPSHSAVGRVALLDGPDAKYLAMEDAIQETVREYMRTRIYNKPRRITGSVTLTEPPRVRISSGAYVASVKLKIRIEEVQEYEFF